jgi:hypothetical protein
MTPFLNLHSLHVVQVIMHAVQEILTVQKMRHIVLEVKNHAVVL